MRTKTEFVEAWKKQVAGGFIYGYHSSTRLGPVEAAERVWNTAAEVEALLGRMWDWLQKQDIRANGKPVEDVRT